MFRFLLALIGVVAITTPVSAQQNTDQQLLSLAVDYRSMVLENMDKLMCGETACAPATREELRNPPVPDEVAAFVVSRGMTSGVGEICGLDWQARNFLPMMAYFRRDMGWPNRRMAILGALHGLGQAIPANNGVSCTDDTKQAIDASLDFQTGQN
ncbi:hypothetical protein [Euryhalocaulis caribicus]|uniref:hypothetical protein n=1 Tax=Euryhalocaulis caribicus TaxID=1161401 RepID=UPI0003B66F46|nr:hypothetical protein [Euryhalocaulis caribicus]